ncbi:UNVERIFIED_CONTAM: hypothetical protein HDU68_007641, partial [Siphonaria sp. JEL0065]
MTRLNEAYEVLSDPNRPSATQSFSHHQFPTPPRPKPPPPPPPTPPPPPKFLQVSSKIIDGPMVSIQSRYKTELKFSWVNHGRNIIRTSIHVRQKGVNTFMDCWSGSGKASTAAVVLENVWGDVEFCIKTHTASMSSPNSAILFHHILCPPIRPFAIRLASIQKDKPISLNMRISALSSELSLLKRIATKSAVEARSKHDLIARLEGEIESRMEIWKRKLEDMTKSLVTTPVATAAEKVAWMVLATRKWRTLRSAASQWKDFISTVGIDGTSGVLDKLTADSVKKELGNIVGYATSRVKFPSDFILDKSSVVTMDGGKTFEYDGDVTIPGFVLFIKVYVVVLKVQKQANSFGAESGEWSGLVEMWMDSCTDVVLGLRKEMNYRVNLFVEENRMHVEPTPERIPSPVDISASSIGNQTVTGRVGSPVEPISAILRPSSAVRPKLSPSKRAKPKSSPLAGDTSFSFGSSFAATSTQFEFNFKTPSSPTPSIRRKSKKTSTEKTSTASQCNAATDMTSFSFNFKPTLTFAFAQTSSSTKPSTTPSFVFGNGAPPSFSFSKVVPTELNPSSTGAMPASSSFIFGKHETSGTTPSKFSFQAPVPTPAPESGESSSTSSESTKPKHSAPYLFGKTTSVVNDPLLATNSNPSFVFGKDTSISTSIPFTFKPE